MKKFLVTLAILASVSAASAQSSVTVFGVVDAAVAFGKGDVSNKTLLKNSGLSSSQLGFRGTEDLGGGLNASFWLEAGVNNDDGSGQATNSNNQASGAPAPLAGGQGLTFNRRSTVSVGGGFGEVRLGRDYTPHFWNHSIYDPFTSLGVGASRSLLGSSGAGGGGFTTVRASNTVGYISPVMSGFKVQVQTYFGENASTAADAGTGTSLRASYDQGPLSVGLAYGKTTTGAGTDVKSTNIGASYDLGVAKLMGAVTKNANTGAADVKGFQFGARVPMGAAGTVRASVSQTDNGTAKTKQFALGYVHNLSKRTAMYTTFARVENSGGAAAALNGAVTTVNGSSTGYEFGIKHSF